MKNVREDQIKTCITMDTKQFEALIKELIDDTVYIEFSIDGIGIYYESEDVSCEDVLKGLAEYFGVKEVTSFHIDTYDYPLVWIVYRD